MTENILFYYCENFKISLDNSDYNKTFSLQIKPLLIKHEGDSISF